MLVTFAAVTLTARFDATPLLMLALERAAEAVFAFATERILGAIFFFVDIGLGRRTYSNFCRSINENAFWQFIECIRLQLVNR